MRINVKVVQKNGTENYHSYDFEGYQNLFLCTGLYDKTRRLIYENDPVEYKNSLYKVTNGEFFIKTNTNSIKVLGWYLSPLNKENDSVPLTKDILNKIKVIEE